MQQTFPWSQLRQIYLAHLCGDRTDLKYLFLQCSSLTHFSFTPIHGVADNLEDSAQIVVLPELIQLDVDLSEQDGFDTVTLLDIFRSIFTSKLQRLSIQSCCNLENTGFDDDFVGWIDQSGCKIRSMDLSKSWGDIASLNAATPVPRFLHAVSPHLEDLALVEDICYSADCTNILEKMIVPEEGSDILFPRLTHLRIDDLRFDPVLLGYVIQTRAKNGSKMGPGVALIEIQRVEIRYKPYQYYRRGCYQSHPVASLYASALDTALSTSDTPINCQVVFDLRCVCTFTSA